MYDEEKMEVLRFAVILVNIPLMIVTAILQIVAFEPIRNVILCSCILLLLTAKIIFDVILKDGKSIILCSVGYVVWFINLIANLFMI